MKLLRRFFVTARHWQIFLLLFGVGNVLPFVGEIFILSAAPPTGRLSPFPIWSHNLLVSIAALLLLSWLWFTGSFLRSVVRPPLKPKELFFRIAIIYPLVFGFAGLSFLINPTSAPLALVVALGLFLFVCLIYDFNFVASALVLAETGRPKEMGEGAGTLLLFFFFPIGIWFIQPRINRLYEEAFRPADS